jgi:hypothetical protein
MGRGITCAALATAGLLVASVACTSGTHHTASVVSSGSTAVVVPVVAVAGHPRLWLTPSGVTRLRAWATPSNPVWQQGLVPLLATARQDMDSHKVPDQDCGGQYEEYVAEKYALLFALDALIDPQASTRDASAQRAHTLLMYVMDRAVLGPSNDGNVSCGGNTGLYPKYRNPKFMTEDYDRARYYGEAFPLVVDWIYPTLSAADKATIRKVFLRWCNDIEQRGYRAPRPIGAHLSPQLVANRDQVRWAGDNYFTAHMRNLGMMAMSLDPKDDPGGRLHAYLTDATETWLYIFDNLTRTDAKGGALPEGMEYSPQTASYAAEFLLALHTAGQDDTRKFGAEVSFTGNPFWDDFVTNYVDSLSPVSVVEPSQPDNGPVFQPATYGDITNYWLPDYIHVFGALGLLDRDTGQLTKLDTLRWLAINTPPGGSAALLDRVAQADDFTDSIMYFLLLDPDRPAPQDPRPTFPLTNYAIGKGQILARTAWSPDASMFTFLLDWNETDHEHADGLDFGLYRHHEWLTKQRAGYGNSETSLMDLSEFANSLAVHNDPAPQRDKDDFRYVTWQEGSSWDYVPSGDPKMLAVDFQRAYVYALGDATNLYNSSSEGVDSVAGVSRAIIWLKPDTVVVFDRADTKRATGFKRFWLQVPAPAVVNGSRAVVTTPGHQQFVVTALLPDGAVPQPENTVDAQIMNDTAKGEPMKDRILIEAPGDPVSARFLTVLQGADQGAAMPTPPLIRSDDASWNGAVVGSTAVVFPVNLTATPLTLTVPSGPSMLIVTGLVPSASYSVTRAGRTVTVRPGGSNTADKAGVLTVSLS